MNLQQPKLSMNKILPVLLLTAVVISVAFTACKNKSNGGDTNADNTQSTSEYATVNSSGTSDTDAPAYGFEEDEAETPGRDNDIVSVSTTSKSEPNLSVPESSSISEEESEEAKPSLPPKADSQSGEWGASVNN